MSLCFHTILNAIRNIEKYKLNGFYALCNSPVENEISLAEDLLPEVSDKVEHDFCERKLRDLKLKYLDLLCQLAEKI